MPKVQEIRTQDDLVRSKTPQTIGGVTTDVLVPPGIKNLHFRPIEEVAATLATLLQSRPSVKKFVYNVGENVEITYVRAV